MTTQYQAPICPCCEKHIQVLKNACRCCAKPTASKDIWFCNHCRLGGQNIHHLYVPYAYTEPLKTLIHQFKFYEGLDLVRYLAHKIIEVLPDEALKTQALVPTPLHRSRLSQRGFNQTLLLAKVLSNELRIPLRPDLCIKKKPTSAQAELSKTQRNQNLSHAFQCIDNDFQHITIIDDVVTTGSTLGAIAQGFQELDVRTVDAWALCKA